MYAELVFMEVSLKSNSQVIIYATYSSDDLCTDFESIVLDTCKILSTYPQWKVEFIFREANRAADLLANLAFSFSLKTI